jgi:excisionase family DNA binding protein
VTFEHRLAILSTTELAARLGVGRSTVRRLVRAGQIAAIPVGLRRWYLAEAPVSLARCCQRCGADMGRVKGDRKWCDGCRIARKREIAHDYWQRARAK